MNTLSGLHFRAAWRSVAPGFGLAEVKLLGQRLRGIAGQGEAGVEIVETGKDRVPHHFGGDLDGAHAEGVGEGAGPGRHHVIHLGPVGQALFQHPVYEGRGIRAAPSDPRQEKVQRFSDLPFLCATGRDRIAREQA